MDLYVTHFMPSVFTVKDVGAENFIAEYSKHLKNSGKFEYPSWADYVKTGVAKELAPLDSDWIYVRAAAIIRHLYIRPDTGVGAFRKVFSSKQRRGAAPSHSRKASGKIVRYILKQFKVLSYVEESKKGGFRLTKEGRRELDTVARHCNSA
ncbi:ribosomal protein RPS19 [Cardiosporidium cionae]|uniref:Ribosomal protein RPS19 n=1 Tax=Cardiosporidium cionae TaxID=476202 RepID=A0ABQ7J7U3_9APIC|nr:ribosomal protein RPS19 [Cardiosporidium cionae]|eukprot:KAF8820052.1 ribosomal protein RPS19 [Cardiosporidium cionae]